MAPNFSLVGDKPAGENDPAVLLATSKLGCLKGRPAGVCLAWQSADAGPALSLPYLLSISARLSLSCHDWPDQVSVIFGGFLFVFATRCAAHPPDRAAGTVASPVSLPLSANLFLPQIVHCGLPVAALNSPHGKSSGYQSWPYRLHRLPGACRCLEQLPHRSLSPESGNPQRSTVGVDERRATWKSKFQRLFAARSRAFPASPVRFPANRWQRLSWRLNLEPGVNHGPVSPRDQRLQTNRRCRS